MAKEIRFSKLVQTVGKPETVTLWSKPRDNPAFMKAVEEKRVVTVFQNPSGNKKDFGTAGFHQEKFATYLVFPKQLPTLHDVHIVGIKYELLAEQAPIRPSKRKVESSKARRQNVSLDGALAVRNGVHKLKSDHAGRATPISGKLETSKNFQVKIRRTGTSETILSIHARNISEAETNALKTVNAQKFDPDQVQAEVTSIIQS